MSEQQGFTPVAVGVVAIVLGIVWLTVIGGLVYVAVHFIYKFW